MLSEHERKARWRRVVIRGVIVTVIPTVGFAVLASVNSETRPPLVGLIAGSILIYAVLLTIALVGARGLLRVNDAMDNARNRR
jgi:hypothetical protein